MAFLAPFIVEEFAAYVFAEGAYGGLSYLVGAAAMGSTVAEDILVAGAMAGAATAVAGTAVTAGVSNAAYNIFKGQGGKGNGGSYNPIPVNPPARYAPRRRKLIGYQIKKPGLWKKSRRRRRYSFHE